MNVSEKVDAEFINAAAFKITDQMHQKKYLYKIGAMLLSESENTFEKKIKYIDELLGLIDSYVMRNEMKKALVYTVLLKKKVNSVISEIDKINLVITA